MVWFDPVYFLFMLPAFILAGWAQYKVKHTFAKFARMPTSTRMTGAEVARRILERNGIRSVSIEETQGRLSDHYDPRRKILRLSSDVYHGTSVSAMAVAAHEVGHAIQDKTSYGPLALRQLMAPMAMFGSNFAWIILIIGFVVSSMALIKVGIGVFTVGVIFTLITLPVEFDASRRAKKALAGMGMVYGSEEEGIKRVLSAAALTYVAAALAAVLQLLYLLIRSGLLRSND